MDKLFHASAKENDGLVTSAMEAVRLKFVDNTECIDEVPEYEPEFAHQHFGESENIVGYTNLRVKVLYTDCTLFLFPEIKYDFAVTGSSEMKDDIFYKIKDTLPSTQLSIIQTSMGNFSEKLKEQKNFLPPGKLISNFLVKDGENGVEKEFKMYKIEDGSAHNEYIERAQALSFWYIDAVQYTDNSDDRFFHYFLFECYRNPEGVSKHRFAGYATLYRFFHYPDKERIRVAHMLVSPPYRHCGIGVNFINGIYNDLKKDASIYDITAESPADNFVFMRDYADVVNCSKLFEFSKEFLMKGYNKAMQESALKNFKLHSKQVRRVYEILRLYHTNTNIISEKDKLKADILKRLNSQFNSKKNFSKLSDSNIVDGEKPLEIPKYDPKLQSEMLKLECEKILEDYYVIINRIRKHMLNI